MRYLQKSDSQMQKAEWWLLGLGTGERVGNKKLLFNENEVSVMQDEEVLENLLYNIVLRVNNIVYFKVVRVNLMCSLPRFFFLNE